MKILIVHNYYQQAGGEDSVVAAEFDLLKRRGHEVELWSVDNRDLPVGLAGKINVALTTNYSFNSKLLANEKLKQFRPNIVHVHNFFPQISPSIYDACINADVPVVQTLHNYRLICPGALLMRNGKICENCITGTPYQAALHGCYRGSRVGSLVLAHMVNNHRKIGTWNNKVSRFIALTEFSKSKFVEAGFPSENIAVKPNFVDDPFNSDNEMDCIGAPYALFVGRISEEKGIRTLIAAFSSVGNDIELKIAGSGPIENSLVGNNVTMLGRQSSNEISRLMRNAAFLIMPSEWYEGFPMVLVEALAHGLPVLASNLGSMAEIISDGENGLLFEPGNSADLANKVRWLINNPVVRRNLGKNARRTYVSHYTPDINYQKIMEIYQGLIC
ncbi:glycosyltransferase family 4 protein [Methylomonas fluvii]|uniref:Glycosyltransferase family 4 protein n=1 Tax=Methylomonas fluvii TaxID=1854564 RepID=A0ABR9D9S3_9GAMM|nr:glycosyltransferase family 4 protein [Methylomonas fluvii]MBD9359870.1 glycosyltransferase family 4 protein [Methylomonas fluvii]